MEDFIPEDKKELFQSKRMAPYQVEELALQQMEREPTEEDSKFEIYTNSIALRTQITEAFGDRVM